MVVLPLSKREERVCWSALKVVGMAGRAPSTSI